LEGETGGGDGGDEKADALRAVYDFVWGGEFGESGAQLTGRR